MRNGGTAAARKVWKSFFGIIPKDETGRSYEIHHIDGDYNNNDINNLKAVSLQEHYNIHFKQGDLAACHRMATRLGVSHEELSIIAKKRNEEWVKQGKHNWQGGSFQRELNKKRVEEGTHNFIGGKEIKKLYENNTPPWGSKEEVSKRTKKQAQDGRHPWQVRLTCEVCGKSMPRGNYIRHNHGVNCQQHPLL